MKKLKKALICMSLTCTALTQAVSAEMKDGCVPLNLEELNKVVGNHKPDGHTVQNPFQSDMCVPVYYKYQNYRTPDRKFFGNNERLINMFHKATSHKGPQVQFVAGDNGKLYSFMLLDMDNKATNSFRKHGQKMSLFNTHFDDFMKLHEIMHLDPSATYYSDFEVKEKEAVSDIGAVLMIGAKHDFTIEQMSTLMQNVHRARKNHLREHRDRDHYDGKALSRAVELLKEMEDNGENLQVKTFNEAAAIARGIVSYDEDKEEKTLKEKVAYTHKMFQDFYQQENAQVSASEAAEKDVVHDEGEGYSP